MIGSLRGTIIDRTAAVDKGTAEVLLEVGGVGHRLTVTAATLASFDHDQHETFLFVHHHFWEADQRLFGFATKEERNAFEGLLSAHKVGPALALAVISTYPPTDLARVLATDDVDALCAVPGVGKKTAQRLLVDLKSVLVLPVIDTEGDEAIDLTIGSDAVLNDVRQALEALGYASDDIRLAIGSLDADVVSAADGSGDVLKQALRALAVRA